MGTQVFPIIPAHANVYLILVPILMVVLIGGSVATWAAYASRNARFEVSKRGIYDSRVEHVRALRPERQDGAQVGARILDLSKEVNLAPKWKTNGAGFPGYKVGLVPFEGRFEGAGVYHGPEKRGVCSDGRRVVPRW